MKFMLWIKQRRPYSDGQYIKEIKENKLLGQVEENISGWGEVFQSAQSE